MVLATTVLWYCIVHRPLTVVLRERNKAVVLPSVFPHSGEAAGSQASTCFLSAVISPSSLPLLVT
jgi:hypothetical protein